MSGNSIALDTSVAVAVLAGQAGTLLSQSPEEFLIPVPVIGELRYGALNSRRVTENLAEVERIVARCCIPGHHHDRDGRRMRGYGSPCMKTLHWADFRQSPLHDKITKSTEESETVRLFLLITFDLLESLPTDDRETPMEMGE